MRKLKSLAIMTAIMCMTQSTMVLAKAPKIDTNRNHIPSYMAPGTVIKFDKDKKMNIVRPGIEVKDQLQKSKAFSKQADSDLPTIEEDMTIVYDALGGPVVLVPETKQELAIEMKEIKDLNVRNRAASSGSQSGIVSWFDIWAEDGTASGSKASDGAAHKSLKFYTSVSVTNNRNGKSTTVRILDRGPYVNGRILDMSKESFSNVENLNAGLFNGSIRW